MTADTFDLKSLARYLGRDARDLEKLASQGRLPGQRIAGDWRFHRADVHHWLEREMPHFTPLELVRMEQGVAGSPSPLLIRSLLCEETIEPALSGRTAQGVLRSLVEVANRTWKVYDPARVMDAVRERESLGSTALPGGVAIPHPKRRLTAELEESILAFGRTSTGIPLGNDGTLTDLFFLILCVDDQTHLQTIARLSRMFQREDFLPRLRACDDPQACLELIEEVESATYG